MTHRAEPCLCGGELYADDADSGSIKDAVVLHQETLLHIIYRANHGLDAPVRGGSDPTPASSARRDVSGWPTGRTSVLSRSRRVHR